MSITRVARRIRAEGAGHSYDLETYFEGEPDPRSGLIVDLSTLERVLAPWLTLLDSETPSEFCHRLADKIIRKKPFPGARLVKLRLFITDDHWVDVWP